MADVRKPEIRGTSSHVIVACKVALPWLEFQVCNPKSVIRESLTGSREITEWDKSGELVRVRGTSFPSGTPPEGMTRPEMINGYAITEGIKRSTWEVIAQQHAQALYMQNNLVLAASSREEIAAMTRENLSLRSGLEPLQVSKAGIVDSRAPKSARREISNVTTSERV